MARDIKCRGLRIDNGKWVKGWYYVQKFPGDKRGDLSMITDGIHASVVVIPESVGQYTGSKDKNGVEICEGDIIVSEGVCQPCSTKLEGPEPYRDIGDVKWSDIYLGWFFMGDSLADLDPNECKIIGDIHTTPELLEGK